MRGFQNAHAATDGALLSEPLAAGGDRNAIYRGLLTVILRLVFLLYAEERGLLPKDETFARHYLLGGLYRRLRKDAAAYPDTMDQRYGAWAQLVVLFRLLHDGIPAGRGGAVSLPERRGALFDPDLVPRGGLVLQPNEERRRSGSHYTPRELTEPIVRHTLAPLLDRLRGEDGGPPRPEQVLDLKICDPAMGSGAFLVETCRQLADALIEAWGAHGATPDVPSDEDQVTFARRLVAQRCLYGIDRNPMAVDLAKVSLWLSTLARDHPFTFVDHAFRRGDSLVGLTRRQLEALHWQGGQPILAGFGVREKLAAASELRRRIREADDTVTDRQLQALWRCAQDALAEVRRFGDLTLAAFFEGSKPKERAARLEAYQEAILTRQARRHAEMPFAPFHWEIEFPEVFERENPGFDGFVGNPPFAGQVTVVESNLSHYTDWLRTQHPGSAGKCDVVAHFYRRAFDLLRNGGTLGLIATNTIAQGDTRSSGLRWICEHGGHIYRATKRVRWPGDAAVVVSVIHIVKGQILRDLVLDGVNVDNITAFLYHRGGNSDPARLAANAGKSFRGNDVLGMGFTFDDTDKKGVALPLAEMRRLIEADPRNREVIFP